MSEKNESYIGKGLFIKLEIFFQVILDVTEEFLFGKQRTSEIIVLENNLSSQGSTVFINLQKKDMAIMSSNFFDGILNPLTKLFSGKKTNTDTDTDSENSKAYFEFDGINADNDYVFVSKNKMSGRGMFSRDGSFFFISMDNPDDKDSLDESNKRIFFPKKNNVDVDKLENENNDLKEKIKELENKISSLETNLEHEMKQNDIHLKTIAELSASKMEPDKGLEALEVSREIFLDYKVTGLTEDKEKELADIITVNFAKNVNKNQMKLFAKMYMGDTTEADDETYLRLAVFASSIEIVQQMSKEVSKLSNSKELNRSYFNKIIETLKGFHCDEEYLHLLYDDRFSILNNLIEPIKQEYIHALEKAINVNQF